MELTLFGDFCYCDNCCCMKLLLVDGHRRRRGMAVVPVRRGLSLTIGSWSCLLPIDTDTTANCSAFGRYIICSTLVAPWSIAKNKVNTAGGGRGFGCRLGGLGRWSVASVA